MEFLYELGLFLAQALTLVVAILLLVGGLFAIAQRYRGEQQEGHIEVRDLNGKYRTIGNTLRQVIETPETYKAWRKAEKKSERERVRLDKKQKRPKSGESAERRPRLFILNFHGDLKASATDRLREEISALLPQAGEQDEVLVRLESHGGLVHGYGLAASQLQRIPRAGIRLTVAVDKVAASGGYMMACVADRVVAAPFAVVGSIGVLAQLPNFNRLLKKHDIDVELHTAGEYKRTLTMFGENTAKDREKFLEDLEDTHVLFKEFVGANRPSLDIDKVATGEIWYGQRALDEGLVDELSTSDSLIQERLSDWDVYEVKFVQKKQWQEKLGMAAEGVVERTALKLWQRSRGPFDG